MAFMLDNASNYSWKFSGIGIGDGLVDPSIQITSFADFTYYHGLTSIKEKNEIENLQEEFKTASNIFWAINYLVMYKNRVNFYDVDCDISCGFQNYMWGAYERLLNLPEIKMELHVPVEKIFNEQGTQVSAALNSDVCKSVANLFPQLLSNYKTLLYQGTLD